MNPRDYTGQLGARLAAQKRERDEREALVQLRTEGANRHEFLTEHEIAVLAEDPANEGQVVGSDVHGHEVRIENGEAVRSPSGRRSPMAATR